jgi:peptidoglycan hydrolase-like protein with peptidoglycan-binding domain
MATNNPPGMFSTGPAVAALQAQLKQAGFRVPELEVALQAFGAGTRSAFRAFQKSRGLTVTGVLDDATAA